MICVDTVHLKYFIEIPHHLLDLPWVQVITRKKDGNWKYSYYRTKHINGAEIFMQYFLVGYDERPLLVIQISSIPKLLNGSNFIPIHNLEEAIEKMNVIFTSILPEVEIDIGEGIFERVDFFHDYYVANHRYDYINAFSQLTYSHRSRCTYLNPSTRNKVNKDNGVWFKSRDAICKFYDKGLESGDWIADGYIRHECELLDTDEIALATGLQFPTLRRITPQIVYKVLKRDLVRLGLWKANIVGQESSHELLKKVYNDRQAKHLANILRDIHDHPGMSNEELAHLNGIHIHALNKSLRQIRTAGIARGIIDGAEILPPLELIMNEDWEGGIVTKTPSDTEILQSLVIRDEIKILNEVIK